MRTEEGHSSVLGEFHRLLDAGRSLWTTSYEIVETADLLQHRFGLAAVRDLTEHVVPALSLEWVSESLHRKGLERLFREDRRCLSLVDCVSVEIMRAHGLREAVALDRQFAEPGFRVLPARGD